MHYFIFARIFSLKHIWPKNKIFCIFLNIDSWKLVQKIVRKDLEVFSCQYGARTTAIFLMKLNLNIFVVATTEVQTAAKETSCEPVKFTSVAACGSDVKSLQQMTHGPELVEHLAQHPAERGQFLRIINFYLSIKLKSSCLPCLKQSRLGLIVNYSFHLFFLTNKST